MAFASLRISCLVVSRTRLRWSMRQFISRFSESLVIWLHFSVKVGSSLLITKGLMLICSLLGVLPLETDACSASRCPSALSMTVTFSR